MADIITLKRKGGKNPFATEAVIKILNTRIEQEELSSRLYQAMSLWLDNKGYIGAAKSFKKDADGEMEHAQWAKDYLLDMGIQPTLPTLPKPLQEFAGLPDIIRQSYDHEVLVTNQCNELAKDAMKNGDNLLYQLSIKYMQEQQEELGRLQTVLDRIETFGEDKDILILIDKELGER
jgi:ferritin